MAEETVSTQQSDGQTTTSAPADEGLATSSPGNDTTVALPSAGSLGEASASTPDWQAERDELVRINERYKQQLQGWETQSQQHRDENQQLRDQLNQMQQALGTIGAPSSNSGVPVMTPSASLEDAMRAAYDGDIETALGTVKSWDTQHRQNQVPGGITREELEAALNERTMQAQRTQLIGQAHPELQDVNSSLYKAVYEQYERLAADPLYQAMFPADEGMKASVRSPDGMGTKSMDVRIVNDIAAKLKIGLAQQQGRQEAEAAATVGSVAGGPEQGTRTPSTAQA
jgi:hypothetical protein